jgi:hypothetical protein
MHESLTIASVPGDYELTENNADKAIVCCILTHSVKCIRTIMALSRIQNDCRCVSIGVLPLNSNRFRPS